MEADMRTFLKVLFAALLPTGVASAGQPFRDCPDCPGMVLIPAGTAQLGSGPDAIASAVREGADAQYIQDETPLHRVQLKHFAMSVSEITRDQFEAFVSATGFKAGGPCYVYSQADYRLVESTTHDWRDPGFPQYGDHPVVCVNWNDASAYGRWLSQKTGHLYHLPSEAQWEYAARAGTSALRYWSAGRSDECRNANVSDLTRAVSHNLDTSRGFVFPCNDGSVYTASVAQLRPNGFGLHDMLGNVWEWTEDCYTPSYDGAPADGAPVLAGDCKQRVDRGGSWYSDPWVVRSASRYRLPPTARLSHQGFRVVRSN